MLPHPLPYSTWLRAQIASPNYFPESERKRWLAKRATERAAVEKRKKRKKE